MLDDAILLNMDSIQENDRLSLIAADALQEFVKGKDEERRQESLERQRLKAAQLLQNEARQAELDLQQQQNRHPASAFQPSNITNVLQTL